MALSFGLEISAFGGTISIAAPSPISHENVTIASIKKAKIPK